MLEYISLVMLQYKTSCTMTVELLDTDTEQGGEMAEVERWSEYVDKYLCIGGNISDELKQQLTRKPVFLSRYV